MLLGRHMQIPRKRRKALINRVMLAGEYTFNLHLLRRRVERSLLSYCDRRSSTRLPNDPPREPPADSSPMPSVCHQAVIPTHLDVPINPVRGFGQLVDVVEEHAAHRVGHEIESTLLTRREPIFCINFTTTLVFPTGIAKQPLTSLPEVRKSTKDQSQMQENEGDFDLYTGNGLVPRYGHVRKREPLKATVQEPPNLLVVLNEHDLTSSE
ncbi:hypothetical protein BDR22DRAFT_975857 [Usnea florida]